MSLLLSVIIPTRNPHRGRLHRTLLGLAQQSLAREAWELILIDNASTPALPGTDFAEYGLANLIVVVEPQVGLTPARLAGIAAARGEVIVFVDDDNVLCPDYLATVCRVFRERADLAAAGGPVVPEWEVPPPAWTQEFHGLLALRDLGPKEQVCAGSPTAAWPIFAPVGAGLAVRKSGAAHYAALIATDPIRRALDRTGGGLGSGGDNDLVFTLLHAGGGVGYFPDLKVTHLIPAGRLTAEYLGRLNTGIMRTWVQVLYIHGQCPWAPIAPWTVPLRSARAWLRSRAWHGPAERIRWRGQVGQFAGQGAISRLARKAA